MNIHQMIKPIEITLERFNRDLKYKFFIPPYKGKTIKINYIRVYSQIDPNSYYDYYSESQEIFKSGEK